MTREEEIKKAAYWHDAESTKYEQECFIDGANWADENPKNQWHKVEEGLPPVDKYRGIGYFSIETLFTDGKYMFVGIYSYKSKMWINRDYCFPTGRITHWMEVPKKE